MRHKMLKKLHQPVLFENLSCIIYVIAIIKILFEQKLWRI